MKLDSHQLIKHVHSNISMRELRRLDITVELTTERDMKSFTTMSGKHLRWQGYGR